MFGSAQSWHWPMVEYVVPVHVMQSVRSALGPLPAGQAEHVVLSLLTTLGLLQSAHTSPKLEYVVPMHPTQAVRSAFGSSPGAHFVQD